MSPLTLEHLVGRCDERFCCATGAGRNRCVEFSLDIRRDAGRPGRHASTVRIPDRAGGREQRAATRSRLPGAESREGGRPCGPGYPRPRQRAGTARLTGSARSHGVVGMRERAWHWAAFLRVQKPEAGWVCVSERIPRHAGTGGRRPLSAKPLSAGQGDWRLMMKARKARDC